MNRHPDEQLVHATVKKQHLKDKSRTESLSSMRHAFLFSRLVVATSKEMTRSEREIMINRLLMSRSTCPYPYFFPALPDLPASGVQV